MPLFISDEEFLRCSNDAGLVAEKADAYIRELNIRVETVKAEADARSITQEQTCSLIEQKYVSLSGEYSSLQSQNEELSCSLEQRSSELGQLQSEKQQLVVQLTGKDGEIERLTTEASELHKSKRQLMELLEQKDLELHERNTTIKSYLDKIVNLTESAASKDARLGDLESELGRMRAKSDRLLQEKELLEGHNTWLNKELTTKVNSVLQMRKEYEEYEADMSFKLEDVEKKLKESSSSLEFHKDMVRELEEKLSSTERELSSTIAANATAEKHFLAEISTVNKLVDLHKERSEEWSKKSGDLEGVIKALETHLNQVESEYKDRLEKEVSARKELEKESADLRQKLQTCNTELEKYKKDNELIHLPLSSLTTDSFRLTNTVDTDQMVEDDRAIIPRIPAGVSGTALATSLLRDGWTVAKMYAKYQEAVDALRHEHLGRKQAQTILERVLYEIEEKAGLIMDEREEHERLLEAYSALDQKMQYSLSEHSSLETTIQELKASLKRQERDYAIAQKEIVDLQQQVAVLLKECRDVQLRCGSVARYSDYEQQISGPAVPLHAISDVEGVISEQLLTFKDINGLVEQNVQLRSLVRNLSDQLEEKEAELKDKHDKEFQMHSDATASKVNAVLLRAEEQARMIESLHNSVAMYKKLYEEEHKLRSHPTQPQEVVPEQRSREVVVLRESDHDTSRMVEEKALERLKNVEEDLAKSRNDIISLRSDRDQLALEARFAQEKLARFMKDFEHQREEHNGVLARNVELSQFIVNYQKQLRESAESLNASNELSRKLSTEVSVLKHEKEILLNSEKRASDEVRSLSERVYRLQASLDTIQSAEEVREEARGIEKRKQEEYINKMEREWAEAKKELQEEKDNAQRLSLERESNLKEALRKEEELRKELADAKQSLEAAKSMLADAKARYADLERIMKSAGTKDSHGAEGGPSSSSEKILANLRDEIENLRGEAQASKEHMHQYKSIAQVNEEALKQMELVHNTFKNEADAVKRSLEAEVHSLRERVNELENECKLKTQESISANAGKEEALAGASSEISQLKDDISAKMSHIVLMESQISALKEDFEAEHRRWRSAQDNYERQVILQSETIQELTKTSEALASAQKETSELHKVVDLLKTENEELKCKWEMEKSAIEVFKNEADKKYSEVDELNKILHSRLEAFHIRLAEKERGLASGSSSSQNFGAADDGMQKLVNYLRRSKEMAEREISLLKQQNLQLQSQLESAMKSAEEARSSLHTERAKSQASIYSEEDFKSLQLQIRELSLLRESNVQLREENRHNFEECQKLREAFQSVRVETETLEKLLRDKDSELESYRKEVESLKTEKVHLEERIGVLVVKCQGVDIDEHNRLKEAFQQMQANLREKDAQLEEIKKVLAEKQDSVSQLERDLARSRTELNERETRINDLLQAEASLKSDVEKFKRFNAQVRRKSDNLLKEKDSLLKEKDDLSKEVQALSKQLEEAKQVRRKYDNLLKEKEDLSKEVQALSKQLEEAKQAKRNTGDSATEQALREKEKERDSRLHLLEKAVDRNREELRKEREKSEKIRKIISDSKELVTQEKTKLSDELEKHKHALKMLQDKLEKLRNSGGSQSESTSVIPEFSLTLLDDFASAYFQAVENFDQAAQPTFTGLDSATTDAPSMDNASSVGASTGQTVTPSTQTPAPPSANSPLPRSNEEKERKIALARANIKTGRKLVRPNITKPKEPQGDVEMSEADESNTGLSSTSTEGQGNVTLPTIGLVRKRPLASSSSDLQEETPAPEETSSDMPVPALKKSKASDSPQEGGEEQSAAPAKLSDVAGVEETLDDVENLQGTDKEEPDAERDDIEAADEQVEEPTPDEEVHVEPLNETSEVAEEKSDKPSEPILSDDQLRDQTEQDIQKIFSESGGEREEGELVADFSDNEGDSTMSTEVGELTTGEFQTEQSVETENSPSRDLSAGLEVGEIDPSPEEDKNGDDGADTVAETDRVVPESPSANTTDDASASAPVDVSSSEQGGTTPTSDKPVSPVNAGSSTTISINERAKQNSLLRQAGMAAPPLQGRGRGRVVRGRGRGARTARGRGQSPG